MAMKRVLLGKSGIEVSELCLGTMQFGPSCDEAEADRTISAAVEHGANFIDTAAAYLPTEDFVASLGSPWPWSTPFFEVDEDGADVSIAGALERIREALS